MNNGDGNNTWEFITCNLANIKVHINLSQINVIMWSSYEFQPVTCQSSIAWQLNVKVLMQTPSATILCNRARHCCSVHRFWSLFHNEKNNLGIKFNFSIYFSTIFSFAFSILLRDTFSCDAISLLNFIRKLSCCASVKNLNSA